MRATGLTCLAGALWGTVGIATQLIAGEPLAPEVSALSRTAIGALVLFGAAAFLAPAGSGPVPWPVVAIFGLAGAVFQITLFASYPVVGVSVAVIVTACLPVVLVACWDTLVARLPPGPELTGAILIAGAGVVLAGLGSDAPRPEYGGGDSLAGLLLVGLSSFAFAAVAIAGRELGARMHPLRAAGLGLAATAVAIGAFAILRSLASDTASTAIRAAPSVRDLALLAYVGVVATGGAYCAFVTGLSRASSATAGLAPTLVEPAVATLLAALVLHERMTALSLTGCLMVVTGMLALSLRELARRPHPNAPLAQPRTEEP